ncbi:MAG: protein phosphatase 2C domain-containing protein [Actinomycetota bacterium]
MSAGSGRVVLRAGAATDVGRLRPNNQDSYALLPEKGIYVVADGMGGAQGGEVASRMAIETITESYSEPSVDALAQVIAEANERIHAASERPNLRGMGTTTVAIALIPDEPDGRRVNGGRGADTLEPYEQLLVVNVGDSRAYLFRDGGLTQLTDDHSVVAELVRDGRITAVEAEAHPQRNIITRVLGVYPQVTPDIWPIDPIRGDRYLLCSDGLFNEVSDDQMSSVLRRLADPTEAANELVRLANEGGGRDNITVIVLDVVDDGGAAERASAALAGEAQGSSRAGARDLAGFSTAVGESRAGTAKGRKGKAKAKRASTGPSLFKRARRRVTWRVLVFTLMLAAVIGGAFATIQWYGTSTYYVGFHGDEVAIYQGRPGGLLWIDPTLEQDTAIKRDEVPVLYITALEAGHEHSSLADAKAYVSRIERDIIERAERAESATTTTTAPPTTAAPPSTAAN